MNKIEKTEQIELWCLLRTETSFSCVWIPLAKIVILIMEENTRSVVLLIFFEKINKI